MIDIKKLTENPDQYKKYLKLRGNDPEIIDQIIQLDKERRTLTGQVERLRNEKKESSRDFGKAKKEGSSISQIEERIKDISSKLDDEEKKLTTVEEKYHDLILTIPNVLLDDVSEGKDEKDNVVVRTWGEKPKTKFKPHDHVEIGEKLKIIDLKRASKVAGARFAFMCGFGAKLERALSSFMLDIHTDEHGYLEIIPPLIVNEKSLIGTGQLPKFSDELFKLEKFPYYLIPTSEVPVTNYFADEIIDFERLPIKFAAFSSCFRSEAGSYGKETRGITRQHHFNKVELVKFTTPEKSIEEHESLTRDAERILQLLGLHYRVVSLSSGEIGFGAAKCYDIEVWLPSINVYKEISSCSNYLDFQARRAKIRYRDPETGKPAFVHTINGSGLAIGRTIIAILEQYQNEDGSVTLPEVLRPYMGDIEKLS